MIKASSPLSKLLDNIIIPAAESDISPIHPPLLPDLAVSAYFNQPEQGMFESAFEIYVHYCLDEKGVHFLDKADLVLVKHDFQIAYNVIELIDEEITFAYRGDL